MFRPQVEPVVSRDLRNVGPCDAHLPVDQLIASARQLHPDGAPVRIEILEGGLGATIIRFADSAGVYVNPCSGHVLGQQRQWGGFFGTLEGWHRLLFVGSPDLAELVAGSLSLVVALVMVIGGLVVWWPPNLRALRGSFKFQWHLAGRAFDRSLHRTAATYAGLILLMSTVTSLTFTFGWARNALFLATGSPLPVAKPAVAAAATAMLPAETFIERARSLLPNARDVTLTYPRSARAAVEIYAIERDAPHPNARSYVYLNPYTGDVLRFEPYAASSPGNKAYRWLGSLHTGGVGGWPLQLLLFAGILGVPVLAWTGVRGHLRRTFPPKLPNR